MRIWWQSFIDATASAPYMARLQSYLNEIAALGTEVVVHGISPPDRGFSRLSEFRCAVQAVDNGLEAEAQGYDAFVFGHFQEPGLFELKSGVRMPVIGVGEATLHFAAQMGRKIGLISLDDCFRGWHQEQADRCGLGERISHVAGMNCDPSHFSACFEGDDAAKSAMIAAFTDTAAKMVADGADVIVPAGVLPGLLIGSEYGLRVGHAPVVNCAAVGLMQAEMQVRLYRLNGLEVARGGHCELAPAQAKEDFRRLVREGRSRAPAAPSQTGKTNE